MVNSIEATTIGRQEAIAIGNLLFQKGLFHHILKKHAFDDKNLFYQFTVIFFSSFYPKKKKKRNQ